MMQIASRFECAVQRCTCGKLPLHVFLPGPRRHFAECPPCKTRTELLDSEQRAAAAWNAQRTKPSPQINTLSDVLARQRERSARLRAVG